MCGYVDQVGMNKLSREEGALTAFVEGNSIHSTVRMTGPAKNAIVKLLAESGLVCIRYKGQSCTLGGQRINT